MTACGCSEVTTVGALIGTTVIMLSIGTTAVCAARFPGWIRHIALLFPAAILFTYLLAMGSLLYRLGPPRSLASLLLNLGVLAFWLTIGTSSPIGRLPE